MIRSFGPIKLVPYDRGIVEILFAEEVRCNPIDSAFCEGLEEVSRLLEQMPDVRAVLFRAAGSTFSIGGDLKLLAADLSATPRLVLNMTQQLNAAIVRLQKLDAPLIAAVRGACAGGMVGFVAGCDIVIAADDAQFVAAYARIGISCDAGSSVSLAQRMGFARARRYLLLNETLSAAEARAAGLVDFVVPSNDLIARSKSMAAQIGAGPTRAFGATRRLLRSASGQSLTAQLESEAVTLSTVTATHDAREGITAFVDKRTPLFSGD